MRGDLGRRAHVTIATDSLHRRSPRPQYRVCAHPVFCDDVAFRVEGTEHVVAKGFFRNDELVRIQVRVRGVNTLTNIETGDSITDNWAFVIDEDLVGGSVSLNGTVFNINDQGHGIIVQDTGRVVFDLEAGEVLEVNGPHQALDQVFLEQTVCSALSDD